MSCFDLKMGFLRCTTPNLPTCNEMMTYHFRMEIIHCEVCGSKVKRYNWLKHLETKTHKRKAKDEDLTHLAGVLDWNQCGKCQAHRSLDMFKEGNETCNSYLDRNKRWAEKNHEREKKKRDEQKRRRRNTIRNMQ